jgi:hypothetical protein
MGKQEILICDCGSREHQIVFEYDQEDSLIYCSIHLADQGFWKRLKLGLKYIFGYKCLYGHWENFVMTPEHVDKLKQVFPK